MSNTKRRIKKPKQKMTVDPITSLCNISGIQETDPFGVANFKVDDCLDLLDQATNGSLESKCPISQSQTQVHFNYCSELWRGIKRTKIQSHASIYERFSLPHIQVELARHKHISELSKYLLSNIPHLRMPSFERWIIDSKIEEHEKRRIVRENNEAMAANGELLMNKKSERKANNIKRLKRKNMIEKTALENHLTSSGLRVVLNCDPVIPSMADVNDQASQRLIKEIEQGLNQRSNAKDVVKLLCKMSCDASRTTQNLQNHLGSVTTDHYFGKSSSLGKITLEISSGADLTVSSRSYSLIYTRKSKPESISKTKPFVVKINQNHYAKLRDMFHSMHENINDPTKSLHVPSPQLLIKNPSHYSPATNIFHHLVFCILLRYASLAGAQQLFDLRGGGMQGSIHSEVFDCISKFSSYSLDKITECFASPLNVYSSRYFSIFHRDLDVHFGSLGDFFSVPIGFFCDHGIHEANPPFSPGLMDMMFTRLENHLIDADARKVRLTFLIVVPTCKRSIDCSLVNEFALKSFESMLRSEFFTKHIQLSAREHGYIEGSQHLRPTRFKESQYSTSVIILQSKSAKIEDYKLNEDKFEAELREAFVSRHQSEVSSRKRLIPIEPEEGERSVKTNKTFQSKHETKKY